MIIEIMISNIENEKFVLIDVTKQRIIVNNTMKQISEEQINDLLRIIRDWKNSYTNKKNIDSEEFIIKISDEKEKTVIKGQGAYPDNYHCLKEWISDFYE